MLFDYEQGVVDNVQQHIIISAMYHVDSGTTSIRSGYSYISRINIMHS